MSGVETRYWHGAHNPIEHRTVGTHRAWCHTDKMWCYPGTPVEGHWCWCCLEAEGYQMNWVKPGPEETE